MPSNTTHTLGKSALPLTPVLFQWQPIAGVLITGVVFDRLFWEAWIGLNLSLFSLWVVLLVVWRYGWDNLSLPARAAFFGTLLAGAMVYVHHSIIAVSATLLSLGVFTALAHEHRLRTLAYAFPQLLWAFILTPLRAWEGLDALFRSAGSRGTVLRWIRVALLPILIGVLFFQLYRAGNPRFDGMASGFLGDLSVVISGIFTPHTCFVLFGLMISATLVGRQAPGSLATFEERWTDALIRTRKERPLVVVARPLDLLERERRAGLILLVLVNLLLFVVNAIDIEWVWIRFEVPSAFSLKQFVHTGTWVLIISILLSMVILLHIFRGNQNFYARSRSLKWLASVWIAQNFILGISVLLRNYHYITFHGLAYKRIGVIVFLALVMIGLVTLYVKVLRRKSFFFLVRVNAWAWFSMMLGLATVDWDSYIVRHNLRHDNPGEIDIDNYLVMSDKVLPLLYANMDVVEAQMEKHRANEVLWVKNLDPVRFRQALNVKCVRFLRRCADQQWREHNLADERTRRDLLACMASHRPAR